MRYFKNYGGFVVRLTHCVHISRNMVMGVDAETGGTHIFNTLYEIPKQKIQNNNGSKTSKEII